MDNNINHINDNANFYDSKRMSDQMIYQTPNRHNLKRLSSNLPDSSDEDQEGESGVFNIMDVKLDEVPKINQEDTATELKYFTKPASTGRRSNKDMKTVKTALQSYSFQNNEIKRNISEFKENLWDLLINGNYRVKFSPKCATRAGAKAYCARKFDNTGYPLYRLIPPNDTDFYGNPICDLNGDKVDDVIIVDKQGKPAIVNGYKLVKADPYKKMWLAIRDKDPRVEPFNIWLQRKFELNRTWDYSPEQWAAGRFADRIDLESIKKKDEATADAYNYYSENKIGKPRLSKRITARGLWSSIFSKVWKIALCQLFLDTNSAYNGMEPLRKILNYMKVCTAIFIETYEVPLMKELKFENRWFAWVNYKNEHSKEINSKLGQKIQKLYNGYYDEEKQKQIQGFKEVIPLDEPMREGIQIEPDTNLYILLDNAKYIIINVGLNITSLETLTEWKKFAKRMVNGNISKKQITQLKDMFKKRVDNYIDKLVGGNYTQYRTQLELNKQHNADRATGLINYVGKPKNKESDNDNNNNNNNNNDDDI